MKMFLAGAWRESATTIEVRSPYDNELIDTVPQATPDDIDRALAAAQDGAEVMRATSAYERFRILRRTADLLAARQQQFAELISREEGKTLREGLAEVQRAADTLELSAEEARRLGGESLSLDAAPNGADKFGFTLRVPCGVVVAITPFNFPLNLVCHKVGPALAAGNSVIIKPASDTPLSALMLVELLIEAGLPPLGVACITGRGGDLGRQLCADPRVRKITFTGSAEVGRSICEAAGLKRVTMELGSNSPLIVMDDADLSQATATAIASGYSNAGQVCISAQRVIADQRIYDELVERLGPAADQLVTGNPLDTRTDMGPMIRERDAERVQQWIDEAVQQGARLVCGGARQGTFVRPTVLADVRPEMRVSREELFGPAVVVTPVANIDEAVALANDSRYGLSAAVFTQNLERALYFAERLESGNIHINGGPGWRADLMPYGGMKESGFGKEGPKYAVEAMTELKTVVIHRGSAR